MAAPVGLAPTTTRFKGGRTTIVLQGNEITETRPAKYSRLIALVTLTLK